MLGLAVSISAPGAVAAALIIAALYAGQAIALRVFGECERAVRWSACAAVGICTAITAFQWLLAFGAFRIVPALGLAVAGTLATRWRTGVRAADVVQRLGADLAALSRFLLGPIKWLWPLRTALIAAAGHVVARALILPPLGYDSLSYHGPRAALWIKTGREVTLRMPGGWELYRHFPNGGESLGAWAMLPLQDDTFYILVDAALWLAWLPVLVGLCTELELPRRLRAALCLYAMTVPAIYYFVPSGYVDVLSYFLLTSMTLFALRAIHGKTPRASACFAIACGISAITVKVTALALPVIAAFVMLLATRAARAQFGHVMRAIGCGAAFGLLALGPMLVRATIEQGYPFSPFPLRLLGITLGVASPELRWASEITPDQTTMANEIHQLATVFGLDTTYWPSFAAASIPLVVLSPFGLWRLSRDRRWAAVLFGLLMACQIAAYLHPEFTTARNLFGYVNARFFALVPTFAALLVARLWRGRVTQALQVAYFIGASGLSVWFYVKTFVSEAEHFPLLVMLGVGSFLLLLVECSAARVSPRVIGAIALALLAASLVCATHTLQAYRTGLRYVALSTSAVGHRIPWYASGLAPAVDQPGDPHRIAITAGPAKLAGADLIYYFLGTKFQNELVYVSPARDYSIPVYDRERPVVPLVAAREWAARVRASGASHVVVLSPAWHEFGWLQRLPNDFEPVVNNGVSWLFRVRR